MARSTLLSLTLSCLMLSAAGSILAAPFTNDLDSFSADTPRGEFECICNGSTDYKQVLMLDGIEIYRQPRLLLRPNETNLLQDGIVHEDIGCPTILDNREGFILMIRNLQPPQYGVMGYVLADFNESEPTLIDLGIAENPQDDEIPPDQRLTYNSDGFTLHYFGYAPGVDPQEAQPKPTPAAQFTEFHYKDKTVTSKKRENPKL